MSNWKIEDVNRINDEINEMSLDIDGLSYLVIFGGHANGGFCAIPQMGVSCELSSHDKFEDMLCNVSVCYHESESPRFERKKMFKIVK